MPERRFPPPWSVEETAPCFIVRDANGQALAFIYCEDEPGRRADGQAADPRRGPAHRRQHRQAAGAAEAGVVNRTGRIAYAFSKSSVYSGVAEVASQAVIFCAVSLKDNQIARIGFWKFRARTHNPELDWCGLIDVRYAPIATKCCDAEKCRDGP
jgi:hypothetical protein